MWKDVIDRPEKNKGKKKTYYANYKCVNCGKESNLEFEKGTLAPARAKCLSCECWTAEKRTK